MHPDLTAELRRLVTAAEADLRERSERTDLPWAVSLRAEYQAALAAGRTAFTWSQWRDGEVAQAAVAWVLGTVFVRFCEDNDLLAPRWIAGPGAGLARAVDAESAFYAADPRRGTADWLREAFGYLADLPATGGILDRDHSLVWSVPLGDDTCRDLLAYWRTTTAAGDLVREVSSPDLDTRFLGDLYQDLSELAKKQYALLQTPDFVQEFILDRTLTPALAEFGLPGLRVIDPTCGSGHFLLGAFGRLLAAWQAREPGAPPAQHVHRALDAVHGVDLNPFAAAIARFRLAVAALAAAGFRRLAEAPAFPIHVAVGDSLLGAAIQGTLLDETGAVGFHYRNEDIRQHPGILEPGSYHVVVGNPPYITVKDKALNEAYRKAYSTCHRQYALSVPFLELFFKLAVRGTPGTPAGYVGQITSNSFMKREFGSKVIEQLLSGADLGNPVDLADVIDTSGAFIPGHGTPTVILIGRRRRPVGSSVRAVLGVRGEPGQPDNPAEGLVWSEIVEHIDQPGHDGTYVTITDLDRNVLRTHPWSLSGGGADDVVKAIEAGSSSMSTMIEPPVGRAIRAGADEAFLRPARWKAHLIAQDVPSRALLIGENIRDWGESAPDLMIYPYRDGRATTSVDEPLWPLRTPLTNRATFQGVMADAGLRWSEYMQHTPSAYRTPLSIAFAFVATHNHFVLDRGGKVFKQSAPVIKLPAGASEDDHLALLGILNSSAACFWLKQVSHPKGGSGIGRGIQPEDWMDRYEFTGTKLQEFPLPAVLPLRYGRLLDSQVQELTAVTPAGVCAKGAPTRAALAVAHADYDRIRARMVAVQEELDWAAYHSYGLIDESLTLLEGVDLPGVALGERAFEIVLARRIAAGEESSQWFDRHRSTPRTDLPDHWPDGYRDLVQRRLDAIESNKAIRLLERPEFKRRWAARTWDALQADAVVSWVCDRLEDPRLWSDGQGPRAQTVAHLAAALRHDTDLTEAARILTGTEDPDLAAVIAPLVADQGVPYLAALRYKDSGLRKRAEWEAVWALQRREDAGERLTIPVPPKYAPTDFVKQSYWAARGKLDVPKERFIAYPNAGPDTDPSALLGWAGWDHADQAKALARLLIERQHNDGWDDQRLLPLLAGLAELEPWLHQWHNDPLPGTTTSPARAISGLLDMQLARIGATRADLAAWRPAAPVRGRRKG